MANLPRNFRLLDELKKGETDQTGDNSVSYGVSDNDIYLSNWNAVIIGPPNVTISIFFLVYFFYFFSYFDHH